MFELGPLFRPEIDEQIKEYVRLSRRLANLEQEKLNLIETWQSACECKCEKEIFWERLVGLWEEIRRTREIMDAIATSC